MSDSIRQQLGSALSRVEAPEELWGRIESSLDAGRTAPEGAGRGRGWTALLMAATLAALMSGGVLYLRAQQPIDRSFRVAAAKLHQAGEEARVGGPYAVQRYRLDGEIVTVVSMPISGRAPMPDKLVDGEETGYALTEWIQEGRRWALVSSKSIHARSCAICHRA